MKTFNFFLIMLWILLTGCLGMTRTKTESAAVGRTLTSGPVPSVTISNATGTIAVNAPAATETFSEAVASLDQKKMSPGMQLILFSIGVLLLILALLIVRRSSASADAAWTAADTLGAKGIRKIQSLIASTPDPAMQASLHEVVAGMEAERGKLRA
jgi:hypothetical protein